jgi:PAS domain S-box-containing protein
LEVHQIELDMQNEELRRINTELDAWQARYFELYDRAPVGYCTVSSGGLIQEANLAAAALLGTDRSGLVKRNFLEFIAKSHQDSYGLQRKKMFKTGEPFDCELQMVKQDGSVFWVHLMTTAGWEPSAGPGRAAPRGYVSRVVLIDITGRKRMEEDNARIQGRNLETLGVLAGGIAHDFNNLLTSILGNASLGSLMVGQLHDLAPLFQTIETAAMRAADLTRQLLAYAGKGKTTASEFDLNTTVNESACYFAGSIPRKVTLQIELADRLPFVWVDPSQIFQVLRNLVTNALEAIAEDEVGLVRVRTQAECFDPMELKSGYWALPIGRGHYATMEVIDSGPGMPPEILARAIEPFFTTKFIGRGLGLAAVLGILRSHGGGLRVRSLPGEGSSFKVYLPALKGTRSDQAVETLTATPWRGEGQLLVVDADQGERSRIRHMAEGLGFSVTEAPDGDEAVETFREHQEEVTLVLLGLARLPNGGSRTFRALRKINGSIPVILGSEAQLQDAEVKFKGLTGMLRKPYRRAEFQGAMQRALADREVAASKG